jgi:hypothetical protein
VGAPAGYIGCGPGYNLEAGREFTENAQVVQERRMDLLDDEEPRWRLEQAVERRKAREQAQGRPLSRRTVNARFRNGEHLDLMHQQD